MPGHDATEIYVLGAGASAGSAIATARPPTLTTFWDRGLTLPGCGRFDFLWDHLAEEFSMSREALAATNFEALCSFLDAHAIDDAVALELNARAVRADEFRLFPPLAYFASFIYETILHYCEPLRTSSCPHHDALARRAATRPTMIVSLNYDLLMDVSLRRHTGWSEESGYGILDFPRPGGPRPIFSNPLFLKLHGSVSWTWSMEFGDPAIDIDDVEEYLRDPRHRGPLQDLGHYRNAGLIRDMGRQAYPGSSHPFLVLPTTYKQLGTLRALFMHAYMLLHDHLSRARRVVVIGCRLLHDLHILSALCSGLARNTTLREIEVVIKMSDEDFEDWRKAVRPFLPGHLRIEHTFRSFEEFAATL